MFAKERRGGGWRRMKVGRRERENSVRAKLKPALQTLKRDPRWRPDGARNGAKEKSGRPSRDDNCECNRQN